MEIYVKIEEAGILLECSTTKRFFGVSTKKKLYIHDDLVYSLECAVEFLVNEEWPN